MEKLLISACLLGLASRYDGRSKPTLTDSELDQLMERYELVPFCPEIYGGLPTPRVPSERVSDRVMMKDGTDVTENYKKGASEAVKLAEKMGIKYALLKERSPSCGVYEIYDGSFSGVLVSGMGVAAEMLSEAGVAVFGESDIKKLL